VEEDIEKLTKIYSVSGEKFDEYKKTALLTLITGKRPSEDKTLIIVGGQPGSGKSRVIPIAKRELGNNAVVVDFDELRALHPNYKDVNRNYSEVTHRILHPDTERVKNEVLAELIKGGYDVIYEGALRITQGFIDFASDFRSSDYKIKMYLMSVPKLESYGSILLRYAIAHVTGITPRWVGKSAHDDSYEGVLRTVSKFLEDKMVDDVHVFVRGEDKPKLIYSTEGRQFESPLVALGYGREVGRKKAVQDFPTKFEIVSGILKTREPEKMELLKDWKQLYEEEQQYFRGLLTDRLTNRDD